MTHLTHLRFRNATKTLAVFHSCGNSSTVVLTLPGCNKTRRGNGIINILEYITRGYMEIFITCGDMVLLEADHGADWDEIKRMIKAFVD